MDAYEREIIRRAKARGLRRTKGGALNALINDIVRTARTTNEASFATPDGRRAAHRNAVALYARWQNISKSVGRGGSGSNMWVEKLFEAAARAAASNKERMFGSALIAYQRNLMNAAKQIATIARNRAFI